MNPLLAKEIRLLLPAFVAALLLAIAPECLLRASPEPLGYAVHFYGLGIALLALSSFGREFGLKTFALILTQPFSRRQMWWTKVAVLACAVAVAFGAWFLSCRAFGPLGFQTITFAGLISLVMLAGGLWTTLLLRQVTSAFWFTILMPQPFWPQSLKAEAANGWPAPLWASTPWPGSGGPGGNSSRHRRRRGPVEWSLSQDFSCAATDRD